MNLPTNLPTRLHHNAYVTRDMEATRHFYEDLVGMPLVATWCEADELFGKERVYCHCFFGLSDGSALAFFQFAHREDEELFGPKMPASPFPSHCVECGCEIPGRGGEAATGGGGEGAGHVHPGARLLQVVVRDRSQRHDFGVDGGQSRGAEGRRRAAGRRACRAETVAGGRSYVEQHLASGDASAGLGAACRAGMCGKPRRWACVKSRKSTEPRP